MIFFDTTTKRDYYALIISKKALSPSNGQKLKYEFDLSDDDLKRDFSLPHSIAFEPYVKAFQYKVLNSILYTNYKLHKIGYIKDDSCSFCKLEPETRHHFFFNCTHARRFWHEFESYYSDRTNQSVRITLRDVCVGIINSKCPLLNYLLPTWHLTGCGDADPHNSLKSASSDIFRIKQKKYLILVIKQLLTILKNTKAKEIDYFEMLIFLSIEEKTLYFARKMKVRKKVLNTLFSPMTLDTSFVPTMLSIGRETFTLQQMIEGRDPAPNTSQFLLHYLQIQTKFMMRNKIIFYRFIYFTKSCGKIPTANTFISTVKPGRKLATLPCILISKGKNATVFVAISSPDLP